MKDGGQMTERIRSDVAGRTVERRKQRAVSENGERRYTRRQWLMRVAILHGASGQRGGASSVFMAREAVSSVAIEHPEWDMDGETRTWAEWLLEEES